LTTALVFATISAGKKETRNEELIILDEFRQTADHTVVKDSDVGIMITRTPNQKLVKKLTQLIFLKEYPYSNVTSIRIQGVVP
jgi:hypothetical protein